MNDCGFVEGCVNVSWMCYGRERLRNVNIKKSSVRVAVGATKVIRTVACADKTGDILGTCAGREGLELDVVRNEVTRKPDVVRIGIPSKGGMFDLTRDLLREIGCDLVIANPRQYIATLHGLPRVELWLQRPADIARKVADGTVDLGFTGFDLVAEYGVSRA